MKKLPIFLTLMILLISCKKEENIVEIKFENIPSPTYFNYILPLNAGNIWVYDTEIKDLNNNILSKRSDTILIKTSKYNFWNVMADLEYWKEMRLETYSFYASNRFVDLGEYVSNWNPDFVIFSENPMQDLLYDRCYLGKYSKTGTIDSLETTICKYYDLEAYQVSETITIKKGIGIVQVLKLTENKRILSKLTGFTVF